jgi:hypothetical protein
LAVTCEFPAGKLNRRGKAIIGAMIDTAEQCGVTPIMTGEYTGVADWLMVYGLGHLQRKEWATAHRSQGGHVIGWDLGYWDRDLSMRMTIDADHPHALMRDMPGDRWARSGIRLRDTYDPEGHILLIGMGVKSRAQFGYTGQEWELSALQRIKAHYPDATVLYKAKKPESFPCKQISGSIEHALQGCRLVVCRHSNVSIDACIAGVPAVCVDGAGFALYNNCMVSPRNPNEQERIRFLHNLAYWQYRPSEAKLAWNFIKDTLS